jgi:hypothetical protein
LIELQRYKIQKLTEENEQLKKVKWKSLLL